MVVAGGLTYARASGKGQAIDIAQYEAIHRTLGGTMVEYFQEGVVRERSGNKAQGFQPLDSFEASDGWVVLGAIGEVYDRVVRAIGLDPADPKWQKRARQSRIDRRNRVRRAICADGSTSAPSPKSCSTERRQGACTPIMSSKDIAGDPQYQAREMHVEWDDEQVGRVKGIGIVPKFSLTPGKILRGAVGVGHDNARVYGDLLGLAPADLEALKRDKVI